jgi:hypothetical protein
MTGGTYTRLLGQIIGNFHRLEMALRAFLARRDEREAITEGQEFHTLREGDVLNETPLTDYACSGSSP